MLRSIVEKLTKNDRFCSVVIPAAGSASRMKGIDKILTNLGGLPVIVRTMQVFEHCACVREIVVVTREDLVEELAALAKQYQITKVTAVVAGGADRVHSVMAGLDHVQHKDGLVAIHDGARPLVSAEIICDTVEKAAKYHGAAPAIPVKDTIKIASNHLVTDTPDRSKLFAVQTPQIFDFDLLRGALQKAIEDHTAITDDCSAVEALGMPVYLTDGSEENIKITTPMDLIVAEAILERRQGE